MTSDYFSKAMKGKKAKDIGVVRQLGGDPMFNKPSFRLVDLNKGNKPLTSKPKKSGSQYYKRIMRKLRKEM